MTKPGDWMKDPQWLATAGHFLGGFGATLVAAFWVALAGGSLLPIEIVTVALVVGIGVKEFYVDIRYESGEDYASGLDDWLGWMAGCAVAWGNVGLAYALGCWR